MKFFSYRRKFQKPMILLRTATMWNIVVEEMATFDLTKSLSGYEVECVFSFLLERILHNIVLVNKLVSCK